MSLHDETPTQYFGADPATFTGPHGQLITVSQDHARRLIASGTVEKEKFTGLLTDTGHRPGCAFGRTPRCTCTYLAQWDTTPAVMCVGHDRVGWHYTEAISCEEWEEELDRVGAEKKPAPVADTAGYMSREDAESLFNVPGTLTPRETKMQLPVVIATAGDPAELAEKIIRQNPEYFGHLDPEGIYRPAEPSDIAKKLSDEKLRTEYQKGRAKMWEKNAMIASIMGTAGWAFAVARGVWGF